MSEIDQPANEAFLQTVQTSRYGWAFGSLETPTAAAGLTLDGQPQRYRNLKPNRPVTSDIDNPLHWFRAVFGRQPAVSPEVATAEAIVSEAETHLGMPTQSADLTQPLGSVDEQITAGWQPANVEAWKWLLRQRVKEQGGIASRDEPPESSASGPSLL